MDSFLDIPLVLVLFALFGIAVAVIAYLIGSSHGWQAGYEAGRADEITRSKPRIIQAKKDAAKIARVACLAELNRHDVSPEIARGFWDSMPPNTIADSTHNQS